MKKIIPFIKDLNFRTKISDVTSIALEHNLSMENADSIVGNFIVSGKYKINNVSINEEDFDITVPFDITLDDKYDSTKVQIDIDDFYYEIINEEVLRVHIDVLINNLVYIKKEELRSEIIDVSSSEEDKNESKMPFDEAEIIKDDVRGDDSMNNVADNMTITKNEDDVILNKECDKEENTKEREINAEEIANNLTSNFLADDDNYVTYKVHIIREDQTIEEVISTYKTSREEIEKYNDISNVIVGSKIIIPALNE